MLKYVALWFILTNGTGYVPPLDVHPPMMSCGIAGEVKGLSLDRDVNPTKAIWPDPYFPGVHCEVDIKAAVLALPMGEYHSCTTEFGELVPWGVEPPGYIGIDPHCTEFWHRTDGSMTPPTAAPGNLRISGQ